MKKAYKCPKCESNDVYVCTKIWSFIDSPEEIVLEAFKTAIKLAPDKRIVCANCGYKGTIKDLNYIEE